MAEEQLTYTPTDSDLMDSLSKERNIACDYQNRRREEWTDNYELYRNKVRTNRLTQRQAVGIPLMKETIKTLLGQIDESPDVEWKENAGDQQKEIYLQEKWNDFYKTELLQTKDIQDKKNVLLYGRSVKKLNYKNKKCTLDILDIYDVVVDPLADPLDMETARFVVHQNIFRTVRQILNDSRYDKEAKDEFKKYLDTSEAWLKAGRNKEEFDKQKDRMVAMGVKESDFDKFAADDVLVSICEHYRKELSGKKWIWNVYVYADDKVLLLKDSIENLLGIKELPLDTWCEDADTQDFWPDGPADIVRTPNKIVNVWFSQMVENRTLKNFQMHWYDSTIEGYSPQTYEPGAGRMLPAPGDPNKTIMPVDVSGLDDTMAQIEYLIKVVERATGAIAIEKGVGETKDMTLGEVNILVGKAMERAVAMTPFYRDSWRRVSEKWLKIVDANEKDSDVVELKKKSADGKMWNKKIHKTDWKSEAGYTPIVASSAEQEMEKTKSVQKYLVLLKYFPQNQPLVKIMQKRMLSLVDMTPEEIREIQDFEKKRMDMGMEEQGEERVLDEALQMLGEKQPQAV